jgi:hypothetical protein
MLRLDDPRLPLVGCETYDCPGLIPTSAVDRILKKVRFIDQPENSRCPPFCGPCWLWQGRLGRNGYGRAWYSPYRKEIGCHRLLYLELIGPIKKGLVLDHLCNRRACCSPWHMEPVTIQENTRRGNAILYKKAKEYQCNDSNSGLASDG